MAGLGGMGGMGGGGCGGGGGLALAQPAKKNDWSGGQWVDYGPPAPAEPEPQGNDAIACFWLTCHPPALAAEGFPNWAPSLMYIKGENLFSSSTHIVNQLHGDYGQTNV